MRGEDFLQGAVFSYVSLEQQVPLDHPLRAIRLMVDEALRGMSEHFATGRAAVNCAGEAGAGSVIAGVVLGAE